MNAVVADQDFIEACSCRVWALDGWEDEALARAFNNSIEALGMQLYRNRNAIAASFDEKVAAFLTLQRSPPAKNNKECTVFGVFDSAQDVTPTHMWIEYGGFIYDTVPGDPLCRKPTGPRNRFHPSCEPNVQPKAMVGSVRTYLTKGQSRVLKAAENNWVKHRGTIFTYVPANQVVG